MVALEKLQSKEIYSLVISQNMRIPTLEQYFKTLFPHLNLDWKLIYLLPRVLTKNTSLRAFQYNVLNNVLYLNHKLFNQHDETVQYLFSTCNELISLWTETKLYFVNNIKTIALCPHISNFGLYKYCWQMFHNSKPNFTNFKILRNTSTGKGNLSFSAFFHKVVKSKNPEKGTALRNQRKFDVYKKKMVIYRKFFGV